MQIPLYNLVIILHPYFPLIRMITSDKKIRQFQDSGAVVLRGYFKDWVEPLRQGIEKNLASPSPYVRDYTDTGQGRFFGDYCNWQRIDEYRDFLFQSPAAKIASELMKSQNVRLFHEHVLVKEPGTTIPTPWHHDQPYYCVDGRQNCSIWLALDPIPQQTSLEFVAASHRSNEMFQPERFDRSPLYENSKYRTIPDIEANRDSYEILSWGLESGDAVAFHFLTLHSAPGNLDIDRRRRAFSSRWIGDDAIFAVREGPTSPPFPNSQLEHGEPISGDDFPLIST